MSEHAVYAIESKDHDCTLRVSTKDGNVTSWKVWLTTDDSGALLASYPGDADNEPKWSKVQSSAATDVPLESPDDVRKAVDSVFVRNLDGEYSVSEV